MKEKIEKSKPDRFKSLSYSAMKIKKINSFRTNDSTIFNIHMKVKVKHIKNRKQNLSNQ